MIQRGLQLRIIAAEGYQLQFKRAASVLLWLIPMSCCIMNAQQDGSPESRTKTYTSPDGGFRFAYPASFVWCKRSSHQADLWIPAEACEAYTHVCSSFSPDSSETVACVAYPAGELKDTNFEAAAFSVTELAKATTESACLKVEEPPPHVGAGHDESVNGVQFKVTQTDGVALGNFNDGWVYRTFHAKKCYELDIRIAYFNAANADSSTMKSFDLNVVRGRLKQVLNTFKFAK